MLSWYTQVLLALTVTFSIFISPSSSNADINSLETFDDSLIELDNSDITECVGDAPTTDIAQESSESDQNEYIQSNDGEKILRRQSRACMFRFSDDRKKKEWRAPMNIPVPTLNPSIPPTEFNDPTALCFFPFKPVLLSCSSPEIWYGNRMGYVLNCVPGRSHTHQDMT